MDDLGRKAFIALTNFILCLAALLFIAAGSLTFWRGWAYVFVFSAASVVITEYCRRYDPALLRRRMRAGPVAERRPSQKLIQLGASLAVIAVYVTAGLDYRYGWSEVPSLLSAAGFVAVAAGFLAIFRVYRENSFAAATIEIDHGQTVVATGPYALVRHPMYAGALLLFLGTPLALGSLWGLLPVAALTIVLIMRLLDEEAYLAANLPGYEDYRRKTPFRLAPMVW